MTDRLVEFAVGETTWRWRGPGRGLEFLLDRTRTWYRPIHPDVIGPFATVEEARRGAEHLARR